MSGMLKPFGVLAAVAAIGMILPGPAGALYPPAPIRPRPE